MLHYTLRYKKVNNPTSSQTGLSLQVAETVAEGFLEFVYVAEIYFLSLL